MYLDGSITETRFTVDTRHDDNIKAKFGDGADLQIYHDGSNSYINDVGTGVLSIQSDGTEVQINKGSSEYMARFITDAGVKLYYDNAQKFETTSTGVSVTGITTLGGDVIVEGNLSMDGFHIDDVEEIRFDQNNNQPRIKSVGVNGLDIEGANVSITGGGSTSAANGNLTVAGDLTVNGSIIHGSGGGIFNGDQAIDAAGS